MRQLISYADQESAALQLRAASLGVLYLFEYS
jgi:hypothetical protein